MVVLLWGQAAPNTVGVVTGLHTDALWKRMIHDVAGVSILPPPTIKKKIRTCLVKNNQIRKHWTKQKIGEKKKAFNLNFTIAEEEIVTDQPTCNSSSLKAVKKGETRPFWALVGLMT